MKVKGPWCSAQWFRVLHPGTGKLWFASHDPIEAQEAATQIGGQVEQQFVRVTTRQKWKKV